MDRLISAVAQSQGEEQEFTVQDQALLDGLGKPSELVQLETPRVPCSQGKDKTETDQL